MNLQEELYKINKTMRMLGENIEEMETPMPSHFDVNHFKTLKSFNSRVQYCNQTLKRLGVGSSRRVYSIDNTKVLKLAINTKGIEQNTTESDSYTQERYSGIVTIVYEASPDDQWIISEFAKPINANRFKELTNIEFRKYTGYISLTYDQNQGTKISDKEFQLWGLTREDRDHFEENEFIDNIMSLIFENDYPVGDFMRLNSYGEVIRDGMPRIVLLDYGLTQSTYNDLYMKRQW